MPASTLTERDPPPELAPHEKPTPAEFARIALELLKEQARDDAELAEKMRQRGITT
jgi:hypothetical protein